MSHIPAVSIITATYNRPSVLRYSITSVFQPKFSDWELIVVGDGCADETERTELTFADSRTRFVDPTNSGRSLRQFPEKEFEREARLP
jgi:glycosyltransferase involved in cell wall biosynthesis